MRAEIAKARALPTVRWTLIVVFGLIALVFFAELIWGQNDNAKDYRDLTDALVTVTNIATIVLGVWFVGLEYGQNTLRRTLTADPRRGRLVGAKLGVAAGTVTLMTIAALLAGAILFAITANVHGAGSPASAAFDDMAGAILANILYVTLGIGVAFITRSMAGGMTAMLAFVFVIDGVISSIGGVKQWSFGTAASDLSDAVNNAPDDASIKHAILVAVVWLVVVMGAGALRFIRSDVS